MVKTYEIEKEQFDESTQELRKRLVNTPKRISKIDWSSNFIQVLKKEEVNFLVKSLIKNSQDKIDKYGDPNTVHTWRDRGKIEVLKELKRLLDGN